jgi:hypothetical protein
MLKTLALSDPEYQRQLRMNHDRKNEIKDTLEASEHWHRFANSN